MTPRATVVIPTWNAPDSLGPAIDSARAQTLEDLEILVVGDGATPDSLAIAHGRAATDPRVRVLDLPKAPARGERNRHGSGRGRLRAGDRQGLYDTRRLGAFSERAGQ